MEPRPSTVLICSDYIPPGGGGVEVVVENLAVELAEADVRVVIFTLGDPSTDLPAVLEHPNIDIVFADQIDLTNYVGLQSCISLNAPSILSNVIDTFDPDLIHVHNRFFFTSFLAPIINAIKYHDNIPVVLTLHLGSVERIGGLSAKVIEIFENTTARLLLKYVDQVIAVSEAVARRALNLNVPSTKITVVPNGVDTDAFTPKRDRNADPDRIVLFVGRLVKNKGPDVFLEALPEIIDTYPDVSVRIVGEGPMEDELKQRSRSLGLSEQVDFAGYVESMPETMQAADVFCRPSLSEGMPLTLLEAMACELPPVVSSVAGVPEVVTNYDTGILVDDPVPDEVRSALDAVLADPTLAERIGHNAREYVVENHDWESRVQDVLEVYRTCLQTKR